MIAQAERLKKPLEQRRNALDQRFAEIAEKSPSSLFSPTRVEAMMQSIEEIDIQSYDLRTRLDEIEKLLSG